jgi:hypothetical protein
MLKSIDEQENLICQKEKKQLIAPLLGETIVTDTKCK